MRNQTADPHTALLLKLHGALNYHVKTSVSAQRHLTLTACAICMCHLQPPPPPSQRAPPSQRRPAWDDPNQSDSEDEGRQHQKLQLGKIQRQATETLQVGGGGGGLQVGGVHTHSLFSSFLPEVMVYGQAILVVCCGLFAVGVLW